MLGLLTGLAGERAIAATTHAVESVVLRHLDDQVIRLRDSDRAAADVVQAIIADEREHHERSAERLREPHLWDRVLVPLVKWSTESVIWLGMKL